MALGERFGEASEDARDWEATKVMVSELEALLLFDGGEIEAAITLMQMTTIIEDGMTFAFGPPSPAKPSHELLGEMLLAVDRAAEAQDEFRRALERVPQRTRSLLGLARASAKAGDTETARQVYGALRQIWHRADADLPALQEIHGVLGTGSE